MKNSSNFILSNTMYNLHNWSSDECTVICVKEAGNIIPQNPETLT